VLIGHGSRGHEDVGLVAVEPFGGRKVQVVWDVGHVALRVGLAHGGCKNPAVHGEGIDIVAFIKLPRVGRIAVDYPDVFNPVGNEMQILHEGTRFSRAEARDDGIAAFYEGKRRFKGNNF